jgi:hypothetical protein
VSDKANGTFRAHCRKVRAVNNDFIGGVKLGFELGKVPTDVEFRHNRVTGRMLQWEGPIGHRIVSGNEFNGKPWNG